MADNFSTKAAIVLDGDDSAEATVRQRSNSWEGMRLVEAAGVEPSETQK
jgi:hypothetical protein